MPPPSPSEATTTPELPALQEVRLTSLCESSRFGELDRLEAYYRCRQYLGRRYDWDGRMIGYGDELAVMPGYSVPFKARRPKVRYDLPKIIVQRYTALLFGRERFPSIDMDGDPDAEDYARELARSSNLQAKMVEARNLGGAQGTAVLSWAFIEGVPRVAVHNAKHVTPLRWRDKAARRLSAALEAYTYPRTVWVDGKAVEKQYYFAHYWDEQIEVIWEPIPKERAETRSWAREVPSTHVRHDLGLCPVYWIQNVADTSSDDGQSDFDGQLDNCDDINTLLSATSKGGIANVDPTLVIMDDPDTNEGPVKKGSGHAIYSKGGAKYLELDGSAIRAALELARELKGATLDATATVLPDPDKLMARAQSAAALRLYFAPMLTVADLLRTQYGEGGLRAILLDMLRAARKIGTTPPPPPTTTPDGYLMQPRPTVVLPPRPVTTVEEVETGELDETGQPITTQKKVTRMVARTPGSSENMSLNWPPYFPNTVADNKLTVDTATAAAGNKQVVSRQTAVQSVATVFGIEDVEAELEAIEQDGEAEAELASNIGPQPLLNAQELGLDGGAIGRTQEETELEEQ